MIMWLDVEMNTETRLLKQQCEGENEFCASIKALLKLTVLTELSGDGFRHSDLQILLNENKKLKRVSDKRRSFIYFLPAKQLQTLK